MYRDRSRIIRKIVIIGILLLALGGGAVALHSVYTVRTVYVEGNVHYTEDEIKEIVMAGPLGDNSLYLSLKYRDRGIQDIPFVDVMNVSILAPDTIKITVYEKALAGYVKYLDTYMYFDKDGIIVESTSETLPGVPKIAGLSFGHIVLHQPLPVEDISVFNEILNLTQVLSVNEVAVDEIRFNKEKEATLQIRSLKVELGSNSEMNGKLSELTDILRDYPDLSGTLYLDSYDESNANPMYRFDKN